VPFALDIHPFLFKSSLDLRYRLRTVWIDVEGLNPQDTNSKLAPKQSLFAVPFDLNVRAPPRLPRHMHLDLSQHVVRNVSLIGFVVRNVSFVGFVVLNVSLLGFGRTSLR